MQGATAIGLGRPGSASSSLDGDLPNEAGVGFTSSIECGGRTEILGCQIDPVDLEQALAVCEDAIRSGGLTQHMAINVAKLVAMQDDERLRHSVSQCELVTADGQPVVWASRLLRAPLPARVAGIDLMGGLLVRAAQRGYRVYILGARAEVLERAVGRMRTAHPGLELAGYRDGYFADADEAEVASAIAQAHADILFVAISSPRKEYFLARHRETLGVPFVMGVGGAIDIYAGITRRAPELLQRIGLEWLFRLAQEPRRLFGRYLRSNTRFIVLLSRELVRSRRAAPLETSVRYGAVGEMTSTAAIEDRRREGRV
ncbi:MAG: WecB/TagA/CpsF family glycosyltransferase [Solirubrobacteraceae bacterium]|jgi:N-acetylglucosaminyldiphosphoundecaprenol N-acetyl-beta-D-mannosaminyltransferase